VISFWPFHTGGGRIKDLKAQQIADSAIKSLQQFGRTHLTLRLLYRTLELDPFQPKALLLLSEHYRGKTNGAPPKGDEALAGIVIEFALDPKSALPSEQKPVFEKARLEIMRDWGFVTTRAGESDVDHIGYMTCINLQLGQLKSVPNGFRIALAKLGVLAGVYDPSTGSPTRAYQDWLHANASTLHL